MGRCGVSAYCMSRISNVGVYNIGSQPQRSVNVRPQRTFPTHILASNLWKKVPCRQSMPFLSDTLVATFIRELGGLWRSGIARTKANPQRLSCLDSIYLSRPHPTHPRRIRRDTMTGRCLTHARAHSQFQTPAYSIYRRKARSNDHPPSLRQNHRTKPAISCRLYVRTSTWRHPFTRLPTHRHLDETGSASESQIPLGAQRQAFKLWGTGVCHTPSNNPSWRLLDWRSGEGGFVLGGVAGRDGRPASDGVSGRSGSGRSAHFI